jgi:hypothetical protein
VTLHGDANKTATFERIFDHSLQQGNASSADEGYLAQLVSARTGLSRSEAETRVSNVLTQARQAADPKNHRALALLDIRGAADRRLLR